MKAIIFERKSCNTLYECEVFPVCMGEMLEYKDKLYRVKSKLFHLEKGILEIEVTKVGSY